MIDRKQKLIGLLFPIPNFHDWKFLLVLQVDTTERQTGFPFICLFSISTFLIYPTVYKYMYFYDNGCMQKKNVYSYEYSKKKKMGKSIVLSVFN